MNLDQHIFRQILDKTPIAVILADLDGRIHYSNQHACRLYGYQEYELIGKNVDIFNAQLSHDTDKIIQSIINTGIWSGEIIQRKKDNHLITVQLTVQLVFDGEGNPVGYVSDSFDISGERIKEELIKKATGGRLIDYETLQKLLSETSEYLAAMIREKNEALDHNIQLLKKDLNLAKNIQSNLLAKNMKKIPGLDINIRYIPLNEVGGDFYDIHWRAPNFVRIFLADATGHGVQAALITMLIKGEYEVLKYGINSPAELLYDLNNRFLQRYVSLNVLFSCVVVDIDLEQNSVVFASGGHPAQFLIQQDRLIEISKTGRLIGVLPDVIYQQREFAFFPSDRLLLFSDGIYEQFNPQGEEFGTFRLKQIIKANSAGQARPLANTILDTLYRFIGDANNHDDITLLTLFRTAEAIT